MVFTTTIVERFEKGENLADIIQELLDSHVITNEQVPAILQLLLVERAKWAFRVENLHKNFSNFTNLIKIIKNWNNIDFVVSYYHPTYGIIVINPKNNEHWVKVHELKKDELLIIYAKQKKGNVEIAEKAINEVFNLIDDKPYEDDPNFKIPELKEAKQEIKVEQRIEAQQKQQATPEKTPIKEPKKTNITLKYSVQVTNELFHNGNVEAWKNIIESYHAKYPDCRVIVYYEGELIHDLNSLFKWGKVKHGNVIFFQVVGENIRGVSRLQKYLYEGASPRFEAFLKKDVNKILNLF
ncbi:MAG: hypothetical protein NZ853_01250 [Leptospiraceae bacterium]|nr:hypothetical protein [Leptospiraceae bacterium]MDW7976146.1 hypothetical protein [Leptospiraceae bacterium]